MLRTRDARPSGWQAGYPSSLWEHWRHHQRGNSTLEKLAYSHRLEFTPATGETDGLYRFQLYGRPTHRYREGGAWYDCDLPVGVFTELARWHHSVMRWRPESGFGREEVGTVFVDWGAPLPPLQARALVLCSGFPPRFSQAAETAIYENVPAQIARAVASALQQQLQVI